MHPPRVHHRLRQRRIDEPRNGTLLHHGIAQGVEHELRIRLVAPELLQQRGHQRGSAPRYPSGRHRQERIFRGAVVGLHRLHLLAQCKQEARRVALLGAALAVRSAASSQSSWSGVKPLLSRRS